LAKERLLNLALRAVPADVENIAWLDCDIVFQHSDWIEEAERRLTSLNVIQLYSESAEFKAELLHSAVNAEAHFTPAVMALFADSNLPTKERWQSVEKIRPKQLGFAWAGKRALLQDQGFYDAAILGGADGLMFLAMYGLFEEAINRSSLNKACENHYMRWAESFHKAVAQRVGYMPGKIITCGMVIVKTETIGIDIGFCGVLILIPISFLQATVPGNGKTRTRSSREVRRSIFWRG